MSIEQLSPAAAAVERGIEGVIYQSTSDPSVMWQRGTGFLAANRVGKVFAASTVALLPAAATVGAGARAFATDANASTFASTVAGGGSTFVPVYSDGTDWKIG